MLQPHNAAREGQLLQAHLLAGNLPSFIKAAPIPRPGRPGSYGAPMGKEGIRVTRQVHLRARALAGVSYGTTQSLA